MRKNLLTIVGVLLASCGTPEVNGWRGAEWGMTRTQVETALKQPLLETSLVPSDSSENLAPFKLSNVSLGRWTVDLRLGFREDHLTKIRMDFRDPIPEVDDVIRELTETYGKPTSQDNGQYQRKTAWLLPKTEIECELIIDKVLMVTFRQRMKAF